MASALGILALCSALFTAHAVQALDARPSNAPTAELRSARSAEAWLADFSRQLRACLDRDAFFERLDAAIAGHELASLARALPASAWTIHGAESYENILDETLTPRLERLVGAASAQRLGASLRVILRELAAQLDTLSALHEGLPAAELPQGSQAALAGLVRGIGSHEHEEADRLGLLTVARWTLGSLVLHGAEEPLAPHVAAALVDLFAAMAGYCEAHLDAGDAAAAGTFRELNLAPGSLGWLMLHTELADPQVAEHLARHDGFVAFLDEAREQLARHFTPDTYYVLESVCDPDSEATYLVMTAHVDEPLKAAYARLERFSEAWWLDETPQWGARLVFQVERA